MRLTSTSRKANNKFLSHLSRQVFVNDFSDMEGEVIHILFTSGEGTQSLPVAPNRRRGVIFLAQAETMNGFAWLLGGWDQGNSDSAGWIEILDSDIFLLHLLHFISNIEF